MRETTPTEFASSPKVNRAQSRACTCYAEVRRRKAAKRVTDTNRAIYKL